MPRVTRPHEVFIRLQASGLEAAHIRKIGEIVEDGAIVASRELPARPLAVAGPEFGTLIGHINQIVLGERDALAAEVTALKAEINHLKKVPKVG
jgi:hypothetical protein